MGREMVLIKDTHPDVGLVAGMKGADSLSALLQEHSRDLRRPPGQGETCWCYQCACCARRRHVLPPCCCLGYLQAEPTN